MSFTSFFYYFCVGITLLVYTIVPKKYKWCVLLISSIAYYIYASQILALFLLAAIVIVYFIGLAITDINEKSSAARKIAEKSERKLIKKKFDKSKKAVVTGGVVSLVIMLLGLKYCNFFGETFYAIGSIFKSVGTFPIIKIVLPLGISYYTLCAISYIVDIYRGKYKAEKNFFKLALYLCFFPQMTEGPIGKYDIMGDRLYEGHSFNFDRDAKAAFRIVWGLFKKLVIADRANIFVASVFDKGEGDGTFMLIATILYTIQIYAEFSGCMDIVCGTGELFGVEMQENFKRPIFSKSINEFWRRWHVTLGEWIKEYIFYSVSLSKPIMNLSKSTRKHMNDFFANLVPMTVALFFVWFFNGFWHGASWKYVLYGLYYYVLMIIGMYCRPLSDKLMKSLKISEKSKGFAFFQMARTFVIVNFGMMLFRCNDVNQWFAMIGKIFTDFHISNLFNGSAFMLGNDWQDFLAIFAGAAVILIVECIQEYKYPSIRDELAKKNIVVRYAVFICLILAVVIFGAYGTGYETVAPIYGQF